MPKSKTYWRQKLVTLRDDLTALDKVNSDSGDTVDLDQTKVGRLSRMDALQGQAMSAAVKARRANDLRQIERALNELDDGDFGYCQLCGEAITEKRLDVNPLVTKCIHCAA